MAGSNWDTYGEQSKSSQNQQNFNKEDEKSTSQEQRYSSDVCMYLINCFTFSYDEEINRKILSVALIHVPHYGWTSEAIAQGAIEAGYPGIATGLFPRVRIDAPPLILLNKINRDLLSL